MSHDNVRMVEYGAVASESSRWMIFEKLPSSASKANDGFPSQLLSCRQWGAARDLLKVQRRDPLASKFC